MEKVTYFYLFVASLASVTSLGLLIWLHIRLLLLSIFSDSGSSKDGKWGQDSQEVKVRSLGKANSCGPVCHSPKKGATDKSPQVLPKEIGGKAIVFAKRCKEKNSRKGDTRSGVWWVPICTCPDVRQLLWFGSGGEKEL